MNNFSLLLKTADDIVVMVPKGYVDGLGAGKMEEVSEAVLGKGTRKLIVNFSDTLFINSVGASVLTGVVHRTRQSSGLLCFTNVKRVHREVFEFLGLTKHVRVFPEEGDAILFLSRDKKN